MNPIFKIGDVDLSDYITEDNYSVTETPVYEEDAEAQAENIVLFTAVSGKKIYDTVSGDAPDSTDADTEVLVGKSVKISASAVNVPGDIAKSVFTAVKAAEGTDKISITYAAPALTTADFKYPTISSEIFAEAEDDTYYTLNIVAECPLIRFGSA